MAHYKFITGSFTFDYVTKIIEVTGSVTELTLQNFINVVREAEADMMGGLPLGIIAKAGGKSSLGAGAITGITVELTNSWQVRFQGRPGPNYVQVFIKDGNLVGGINDNPIASSSFTQVIHLRSAAGTQIGGTPWDYLHTDSYISGSFGDAIRRMFEKGYIR